MLPPNMAAHLGMVPMLGMGGMPGPMHGGAMQAVGAVGSVAMQSPMQGTMMGALPSTMGNVGVIPGSMGGGAGLVGPGHPQQQPQHGHGASPQVAHAQGHIHAQSMSVLSSSGGHLGIKQEEMDGWGVAAGPGAPGRRRVRPGTSAGYEGSGGESRRLSPPFV